jgi:hypothetical protein
MPKTATLPFTQSIRVDLLTLISGGGLTDTFPTLTPANTVKLMDAGNEGSLLKNVSITNNDSINHTLSYFLSHDGGASKYLLFTHSVSSSGGFNGSISNLDLLSNSRVNGLPLDQSGKQVLQLASGDSIYVGIITSINSSRNIYLVTQVEDF